MITEAGRAHDRAPRGDGGRTCPKSSARRKARCRRCEPDEPARDPPPARDLRRRSTSARRWSCTRRRSSSWPKASRCTRSGSSSLAQRARLDDLFYAIAHARARRSSNREERSHREVLDELNERLVDKYFVNFSVFESMPDVWAIDQVFPIVPIARLDEEPKRRGVIADLTCDSDGRIDTYVGVGEARTRRCRCTSRARARATASASSWSAPTRRRWATSTTCSATPTRSTCASTAMAATRCERPRRGDTTDVMLDYVGYDARRPARRVHGQGRRRPGCRADEAAAAARRAGSRPDRLHLPARNAGTSRSRGDRA